MIIEEFKTEEKTYHNVTVQITRYICPITLVDGRKHYPTAIRLLNVHGKLIEDLTTPYVEREWYGIVDNPHRLVLVRDRHRYNELLKHGVIFEDGFESASGHSYGIVAHGLEVLPAVCYHKENT